MAQENIVIDLTDENLVILPDIYVESGILDAYGNLILTRTDNGTVTIPLEPLITDIFEDIFVESGSYSNQSMLLTLNYSNDRAPINIDLSEILYVEYGGTNYDPLKTDYPLGYIVTIPDGTAWVSMTTPQTASPGTDDAQWLIVGSTEERGGILYNGAIDYIVGDIVSLGGRGYINQSDSTGIAPIIGGNSSWIDMSLSEYYAGEHTPELAAEYPDTVGETAGAYWVVSGLAVDYTMTTGDLIGTEVSNGDKFLWDGSSWAFYPAPNFTEYGGVIFNTNFLYKKGHMVGYGTDTTPYVCVQDMSLVDGSQDPTNEIYWIEMSSYEKGGILWDTTRAYEIGDVVSEGNSVYVSLTDNTGQQPSTSPGQWINSVPAAGVERGGVVWVSGLSYIIGDVVSEGIQVYMRINTGGSGTTPPSGDPVYWKLLNTADGTTGLWVNTITYYEGDIVSWEGELYVAPPAGVTPGVQPPSSPWVHVTDELGGIAYSAIQTYSIGDIAVESTKAYISLTGTNTGNTPSSSPSDWEEIVSATNTDERGGVYWSNTTTYAIGDMVTLSNGIKNIVYIAITIHSGTSPDTPSNTDWEEARQVERGGVEWRLAQPYLIGDIVSRNGVVYRAAEDNINIDPESASAAWDNIESGRVPLNGIIMYDGLVANIPATYAICDGTLGTPDLRGQFVLGTDSEVQIGETGGSADAVNVSHSHGVSHDHGTVTSTSTGAHTHTADHNHSSATSASSGSHAHTINHNHPVDTTSAAGAHTHTIPGAYHTLWTDTPVTPNGMVKADGNRTTSSNGSHSHLYSVEYHYGSSGSNGSHTHSFDIPSIAVTTSTSVTHNHLTDVPASTVESDIVGVSEVDANLPPYYKLIYIKRIA